MYHRCLAFDLALRSSYKRAMRFGSASQETRSLYLDWVTRFIKLTLVSSRYLVKVGFTITEKAGIA